MMPLKFRPVIVAALLSWCIGGAAFELDLGPIGDLTKNLLKLSADITEEQEIEIGGQLISGLLGAAPLVDDPALQRYEEFHARFASEN